VTGKIVSVLTDRKALLVAHEEVPGVMMAMTMSFQVDPRVLDLVKPEQNILARMERRDDGKWWLFSIRILNAAN
jgi:Cu/Ag efflux protein CusF